MAIKEHKNEEEISVLRDDLILLETYVQDLYSFFPLAFFLVSPQGIILEANPALKELTGYETNEIIGCLIDKFFGEREAKNLSGETLEKGFVKNKEVLLIAKDKKKIPASISTQTRKSNEGEIVGFFVGVFDLSKAKETEKELKESQLALLNMLEDAERAKTKEERAKKAISNILEDIEREQKKTDFIVSHFTDGILLFDEKKILQLINPQAQKIFNIKPEEVLERSIVWLSKFLPLSPLIKFLGAGEIQGFFRKEFYLSKPAKKILEVTTILLKEFGGEGWMVVLHDITREKEIEKMKTEFVSIAAHQLRTPLSAIKWTIRMLLDGDIGELKPEQKDLLEKSYKSNERMISLINDLLNVTRIEEGRYLYRLTPANVEDLTQLIINSYKELAARMGIKLEFKRPEKKLPKIKIDIDKIKIVIQNLLENAIRYTPKGGKVNVSLKYAKKEIEILVEDTGIGIPKDQQERVFSKFFRGANVLRMETEGSGLGLFIAKNITEAHDGRLWFESTENRGTTFHLVIPVKEEFTEFLKEF